MTSAKTLARRTETLQNGLDVLAGAERWTYHAGAASAAEPAAWATLAQMAHGRSEAASRPARWLASIQQTDGAVGVTAEDQRPRWPTALAILAWRRLAGADARTNVEFQPHIDAAVEWALAEKGNTGPRTPNLGHDTTIAGWSWASNTHSWLEPTCFFVQALRAVGLADHPRTRDGVRMIVDRLLPTGGCNYGNTFALGQKLLPHLEPTGVALAALAPEKIDDPRISLSLEYLECNVAAETPTASLCFAVLGLAAHDRAPRDSANWLETRLRRFDPKRHGTRHLALLLLALAQVERPTLGAQTLGETT